MRRDEQKWFCVAQGCTRSVILIGGWAIKFPRIHKWESFLEGLLANLRERRWWKYAERHPDEVAYHRLAPVLFSLPGGWMVVMKRVHTPRQFRKHYYWRMDELKHLFEGLPWDPNEENFGFIGRRLVMIDYGS